MVVYAYNLKPYELRPPVSTDTSEFNIEAKLPSGTTAEQIPVMLKSLLSERFKLAFHREKGEVKGYALLEAKSGVKIKESIPDAPVSGAVRPPAGPIKDPDGFVYIPGLRNTLVVASANGLRAGSDPCRSGFGCSQYSVFDWLVVLADPPTGN